MKTLVQSNSCICLDSLCFVPRYVCVLREIAVVCPSRQDQLSRPLVSVIEVAQAAINAREDIVLFAIFDRVGLTAYFLSFIMRFLSIME